MKISLEYINTFHLISFLFLKQTFPSLYYHKSVCCLLFSSIVVMKTPSQLLPSPISVIKFKCSSMLRKLCTPEEISLFDFVHKCNGGRFAAIVDHRFELLDKPE